MISKVALLILVSISSNVMAWEDSICYDLRLSNDHSINYIKLISHDGHYNQINLYTHSGEQIVSSMGSGQRISVPRNCSRNTDAGDDLCRSGASFEYATLYKDFEVNFEVEQLTLGSASVIRFRGLNKNYPLFYAMCDFIGRGL